MLLSLQMAYAENIFKAKIIDGDCGETLVGATAIVQGTDKGAIADAEGFLTITGIPDGLQTIIF